MWVELKLGVSNVLYGPFNHAWTEGTSHLRVSFIYSKPFNSSNASFTCKYSRINKSCFLQKWVYQYEKVSKVLFLSELNWSIRSLFIIVIPLFHNLLRVNKVPSKRIEACYLYTLRISSTCAFPLHFLWQRSGYVNNNPGFLDSRSLHNLSHRHGSYTTSNKLLELLQYFHRHCWFW